MGIPSLFDLSIFQLANDPRFDLCSAYEQFLALVDNRERLRKEAADKFLDKFLALQVQRKFVQHSSGHIRRFALSRRHVRPSRDGMRTTGDAESECAHSDRVLRTDAT